MAPLAPPVPTPMATVFLYGGDGFGHGRVSFYAAVSEESAESLEVIVNAFKEVNPTSDEIRVIVIDKDFTEYKVLTNTFPQAKVLFGQFHVIKCFNKMV